MAHTHSMPHPDDLPSNTLVDIIYTHHTSDPTSDSYLISSQIVARFRYTFLCTLSAAFRASRANTNSEGHYTFCIHQDDVKYAHLEPVLRRVEGSSVVQLTLGNPLFGYDEVELYEFEDLCQFYRVCQMLGFEPKSALSSLVDGLMARVFQPGVLTPQQITMLQRCGDKALLDKAVAEMAQRVHAQCVRELNTELFDSYTAYLQEHHRYLVELWTTACDCYAKLKYEEDVNYTEKVLCGIQIHHAVKVEKVQAVSVEKAKVVSVDEVQVAMDDMEI